jgi:hypothetical protein
VGIYIPPGALVPPQAEAPAEDGAQVLADDLDKIADALEADRPAPAKRRR